MTRAKNEITLLSPKPVATLADVARRANVSKTATSFVLSGSDRNAHVAPATRQRILDAARELGYHPNALARGLVRKRMDGIGVVFVYTSASPISSPFFGPVLDGIVGAALRREQSTTLLTARSWDEAHEKLPRYRDGRCDGLLLIVPPVGCRFVAALGETNVPFVTVSTHSQVDGVSSVDVDNVAGAKALTAHLLEQGHRRIGVLCHTLAESDFDALRLQGYRQALEDANVDYDASLVRQGASNPASVFQRLRELTDLPALLRPTALLCARHQIAQHVLPALEQAGLRVPLDLSVVAFDAFTSLPPHPSLTVVEQPLRGLGEQAVELLLAQTQAQTPAGQKVLLAPKLIVRDSVAPIAP